MDAPKVDPGITRDVDVALDGTRALVMSLQRVGMSRVQAGNLAALAAGLAPTAKGWSVAEIDRLRFVRWLVDQDRLGS